MKHKNNRKNNHKNNGAKNRDGLKCGVCPELRAEKPNKGSDILAFPANTVIRIWRSSNQHHTFTYEPPSPADRPCASAASPDRTTASPSKGGSP